MDTVSPKYEESKEQYSMEFPSPSAVLSRYFTSAVNLRHVKSV
jgi:hypothetical protein